MQEESVSRYLDMPTPRALAIVAGSVDTLPCWFEPPEGVLGSRVAIVGIGWHPGTAMNMAVLYRHKFGKDDWRRSGRVGTVVVAGWVRVAAVGDRKGVAGKSWPARPIPLGAGIVFWRLESPRVELRGSYAGLSRLAVAYEDQPHVVAAVKLFGDTYGRAALPNDCVALYDRK